MKKFKKSEKISFSGTVFSIILLLLLLLFVILPGNKPEDEGMMVSFGEFDNGAGSESESNFSKESSVSQASAPSSPSNDDLMTQEDPSVSMKSKKDNKQSEAQKELDRKKREAELQRQKEEAERVRREKQAVDNASQLDNLFGNMADAGQGNLSGNEIKGNPAGKGTQDGNSWSLNGRDLAGGLVKPLYKQDVEGVITVNIKVDVNGVVIATSPGKPTTIADPVMREAAINAAKRTRFTKGTSVALGSISYNFKLN